MTMISKPANCKIRRFIDENSVAAVKVYLESDRTRGANLRDMLLPLLVAFLVSGCATAYSPAPLPAHHPANPAAPEASPSPPSQAFSEESILATPAQEAPVHLPRSGHEAMHGGHR